MYGFTRMKRVTDPLDDKAKARIVSSGSEHSPQVYNKDDDDATSSNLSELFFGFGVNDGGDTASPESNDSDSERDTTACESNVEMVAALVVEEVTDEFRRMLEAHVLKALQVFSCVRSSDQQMLRRNVMAFLRGYGHNAAICKTKWESSGGLTAGTYEFIDVMRKECSTRYFVDLDFVSEFEIARPTSSYSRLFQSLPRVFVGRAEQLKPILRTMSDAARRSMKSRGLLLPPWRKNRFMQNKWLGPYRRTTSLFPATFSNSSPAKQSYAVHCRAIGFDTAAAVTGGGHSILTATARTR